MRFCCCLCLSRANYLYILTRRTDVNGEATRRDRADTHLLICCALGLFECKRRYRIHCTWVEPLFLFHCSSSFVDSRPIFIELFKSMIDASLGLLMRFVVFLGAG